MISETLEIGELVILVTDYLRRLTHHGCQTSAFQILPVDLLVFRRCNICKIHDNNVCQDRRILIGVTIDEHRYGVSAQEKAPMCLDISREL